MVVIDHLFVLQALQMYGLEEFASGGESEKQGW